MNQLILKTFLLNFLVASVTLSVRAQMSFTDIPIDTIKIEEIVVTGTPVKVNRNNVPMAVSVVTKTQIEESEESALLPVLNGRVPGLFVTERGVTGFGVATGSAGQISIRGVGGNPTTGVLMLIDGHPQFMGIMGHPLPDSYVASDAERVEVIRGPASVLYGTNAMGGVINIITKKQDNSGVHGNARVSYGSFNTQKYMGALGYKANKFSSYVSVNHDQTDGHRPDSDFKITNGYAKTGYSFNDHFYATADFSLAAYEAADPGPDTLNAKPGFNIDITRGYGSFMLQNEFEKASGSLKLFYNFGEHDITDGFHSTDNNFGVNWFESFRFFEGNTITTGVDYNNYGGMAENLKAMNGKGVVFADTSVTELGAYGFVQQTLLEKLTLNAGIRFQNHSVYGDQWIPSAGFALKLGELTTWKGSASKGFRSPTLRELYLWGPNPALNPETIVNYETGVSRWFFSNKMNAEITVYTLSGDNLIITVPNKGLQNAGEVNNTGVELSVNAAPAKNLELNATYSYISMETPVYATPESHLFLSATYKLKKWQANASLQQVSDLDNDPSPVVNLESYTLLNARLTYNLLKGLKLHVSGENLLSQEYQVNRYYTMPGATVFGGVNFVF